MPDLVTLMHFEAGDMSEREIVEMLAEIILEQGFESLEGKFDKLAKSYIRKGVLDEEGNINYILLKE
jgi:hypothetical protein